MAGKLKDLYVKRNQNQYQPAADSWEARAAELSNMSGGAMPQGETAGNGAFGWLKDSADAGFFNTLGGTARLAGEFMPFGNDTFNSWADKADEIARRNSPQPGQNLEGIDYVASAVGNALGSGGATALEAAVLGSLLSVGGAAGTALGAASKVIPGVGKAVEAGKTLWGNPVGKYLVAKVAGSPLEAGSEAGNLISDMRKENQQGTANYTDDEIRDAALRSGALNLAWLTGMNMLEAGTLGKITGALGGNMAAKGVKDIAKRATLGGLSSGIGEGAEEYGQNLIGDYSKRGNTADFNYDEALEAAKLGAIGGGVLGGVGSGLSATFSKNNSDVSEEIASEDGGTIEEAPEANVSGREAFINAIAGQESEGAGGYEAENGDTKAYGKYQILPSNWPKWAAEAGLSADAPQTPENQEIVARFKLGQYYDKYGARGAAIAWYGGEGALNYSDEALNRKQGDNGEYPSINEYADEVLGRMGNVADSVRIDDTIDDTEENYFDNYTDDTIPDSLNPVRGFDVSHLDKGTAQDRNSLLYGERVKKAKPAPASEEVASFNQSLDNSNAQKAPNSLFANSPRSWDAAERIYKARAKEQAERKARAQAIVNIANAQQQSFLNVLRNRAAQQWDNAEQEYKDRKQDKLQSLANVINARAIQKWDAKEADNAQKARVEQEKQAQLQNIARLLDARADQQWDSAERDANLKQNQAQALANLLNAKAAGQYDVAQQVYANRAKEQAEKQRQQQAITNIINARAAQKFDEAETADKFKFVPQRQSMYDGAMRRNLAAQDKVKPEEQPSVEPTERNGAALDKRNMLDVTLPKVREQHKWDKEHKEYHAERYGESALPQTQLLSTDRAARRNMPKPGIEARSFINDRAEKKSARERMQDAIAFVWKDDPKHPLKACRRQLNMFRDMRKEYLQPIYDVMAEGAGNGVSRIPIIEFDNQHRGRFYRQSNNSPWYAKYFKEHKKKPTKKAMYDIAEEVAFGENADVGYYAGVQGKELEAIVAENHAQLDPINDYIQTYESLELRLKENPNYGKEQAERINKAEEARRAEKRNAGETASAESIQTEAKQPAESNQDEVKETAEPQEKPEPRDLFFTVKSNGKEEDNVIIVDIMPVKEPKYQQTIKKLIDAGWKKAETNTIPNVALDQYYAPATEENYNLAKGLTNKAVGYNLMGGQPGGWDYMQKLLDHEAEERRKSERTLGEILEDEGITADITVDDNQSITIEFSKKPSDEVRQSVKEAGYKWRAGEWKSKVNERSMEIAKELGYKPAEKAETEQSEKLNLPKGTTVDVSIVGDNSNIIQVKFNGAQGKGTGGIMGRAGYVWKSDKQLWQARKTEKAMDVAEQLGYTEEAKPQERDYELEHEELWDTFATKLGIDNILSVDKANEELKGVEGLHDGAIVYYDNNNRIYHIISKESDPEMLKLGYNYDVITFDVHHMPISAGAVKTADEVIKRVTGRSEQKAEPKAKASADTFSKNPDALVKGDKISSMPLSAMKFIKDMFDKGEARQNAKDAIRIALFKSKDLEASARNNTYDNFKIAYFDAAENYLADNVDNNPAYAKLLESGSFAKENMERAAKETYNLFRVGMEKQAESKPVEKQETKEPATRFDGERARKSLDALIGRKKKSEPQKNDVVPKSKFMNVFNEDELDAEIEKAKKEMSKLSANPMFNPALMKSLFKIGGIYLQKGVNKFAAWADNMVDVMGEKVRPFLPAVWDSLKKYPDNQKFNDDVMTAVMEYVGEGVDNGKSLSAIKREFADDYGDEYLGYVDAAFEGVKKYPTSDNVADVVESKQDNTEGGKENGQRNGISGEVGNSGLGSGEAEGSAAGNRGGQKVQTGLSGQTETRPRENGNVGAGRPGRHSGAMGVPASEYGSTSGERGKTADNGGTSLQQSVQESDGSGETEESGPAGEDAENGGRGELSSSVPRRRINKGSYSILENGNYHANNEDALLGNGKHEPTVRFSINLKAIEALRRWQEDGIEPTPEEKNAMAHYSGWGGMKKLLFEGTWENPEYASGEWKEANDKLRKALGKEAWETAWLNVSNQYYTPPSAIAKMWNLATRLGFKGGKVLEPSMGVGNFYALMPAKLQKEAVLTGVEIDPIAGEMAKVLYPDAHIFVQGYEKHAAPENFYDLIIGNVPFGENTLKDSKYSDEFADPLQIHDFFLVKNIGQLQPGGILMAITTHNSLDKINTTVRSHIARKAELVGAIRLPNTTFNGTGTDVMTDLLVFKKRDKEIGIEEAIKLPWVKTAERKVRYAGEEKVINFNKYFEENPQMVAGQMNVKSGRFGPELGTVAANPSEAIDKAIENFPKNIMKKTKSKAENEYVSASQNVKDRGLYYNSKGSLVYRDGIQEKKVTLEDYRYAKNESKNLLERRREIVNSLMGVYDKYSKLIEAENSKAPNLEQIRQEALEAYENHVNTYGYYVKYSKRKDGSTKTVFAKELRFFSDLGDAEKFIDLSALDYNNKPAPILLKKVTTDYQMGAPTVANAYLKQLFNGNNNLDIAQLAKDANTTESEAIKELIDKNAAYKTPSGEYQPTNIYLAGNVVEKLKEAQAAYDLGDKSMKRNIDALTAVRPKLVSYVSITAKMGVPWVETKDYEDFIASLLNAQSGADIGVRVENKAGAWKVQIDSKAALESPYATEKYGMRAPFVDFTDFLEAAMNKKEVSIKKPITENGRVRGYEEDVEGTKKAAQKVEQIQNAFANWLWNQDADRKVRMELAYNDTMNAIVPPVFDARLMQFDGLVKELNGKPFDPRIHQRNFVLRALLNGRGGAYHEAGTGKTLIMSMLCMELRRSGKAHKPLILAHNANAAQVAKDIKTFYPTSKVLYIPKFGGGKNANLTKRLIGQIKSGDWDAVVIPHQAIDKIAFSEETLKAIKNDELEAIKENIRTIADEEAEKSGKSRDVEELEEKDFELTDEDKAAIKDKGKGKKSGGKFLGDRTRRAMLQYKAFLLTLQQQAENYDKPDYIPFETMGIDAILVDECHVFKKAPKITKRQVKGVDTQTSKAGIKMSCLTDYINMKNNNKGVFLFSGTMITNTIPEIHTMMRFVMPDTLKKANIYNLDDFLNTFTGTTNDIEPTSDGSWEPVERLTQFYNITELKRIAGQDFDIVTTKGLPGFELRALPNGKTLESKNLTESEKDELLNGRSEDPKGLPNFKIQNIVIPKTKRTKAISQAIQKAAQKWKKAKKLDKAMLQKEGYGLKLQTLPSAIGMSLRNLDASLRDTPHSKVNMCVRNVMEIYDSHPKACQVIFTEKGYNGTVNRTHNTVDLVKTPKGPRAKIVNSKKFELEGYNLVDDLKTKLIEQGVPENEIAVVDGSTSDDKRADIAERVSAAEIRIVIGSSQTLGVGVNMQRNLRAAHHLDAVWMPGDLDQMNKRSKRQGNCWNTVYSYRYIAPGYDGKMWSALSQKQAFISAFTDTKNNIRIIDSDALSTGDGEGNASVNDIVETLTNAIDDVRVLQKAKIKNKLDAYADNEVVFRKSKAEAADEVKRLQEKEIPALEKQIQAYKDDYKTYKDNKPEKFTCKIKTAKGWIEFTDRAKAESVLRTILKTSKNDKYCEYNGFRVTMESQELLGNGYYLIAHGANGNEYSTASGTFAGLSQLLANIPKRISKAEESLKKDKETVKIKQNELNEESPYADIVDTLQKKLNAIEKDLQDNPVPAPEWFRLKVPIDTFVEYNGKNYLVTGYSVKYNDQPYSVIGTYVDEDGKEVEAKIPANKAMVDGFPVLTDEEMDIDPKKEILDETDDTPELQSEIDKAVEAVDRVFSDDPYYRNPRKATLTIDGETIDITKDYQEGSAREQIEKLFPIGKTFYYNGQEITVEKIAANGKEYQIVTHENGHESWISPWNLSDSKNGEPVISLEKAQELFYGNTQYSVSSEAVQRAKEEVEAEIRAAFPNGKVEYVNGVPTITMPNGSKFQYSIRENIVVNAKEQRKADAAHGTSGARVQGFWKKFTGNGVQRMLAVSKNSERGTAFHEAMHAAIDLVLTEKEKNALYNYYEKKAKEQNRDVDEVIADAYRDWVLARQRKSGTMFGKLWRKVKDFCTRIKAIFDKGAEVERIMQDVESGRVYERSTNNHSVTKRISFSKAEIQGQKGSGTTQVATTRTMYVKALKWLRNQSPEAKTVLDYGAGLGLGTDDMRSNNPDLNIDCYEPNPERWAGKQPPTYTNNTQINKDYDLILNTNVLNVVEKPIRDLIVKDIADHLTMGGKALITTRGWSNDVNAAKNFKPADEHHAIWINKGKNGYVFQKGFDGDELKNYIEELLGDEFVVEKTRPTFGKSSVTITRVKAQPNKSAKQLGLFDTDSYQEMPDSYKTLKGSVVKRSKYGVGKQMGSQVYLHKDYVSDVVPKKVWENALKVLSDADSDFEYNCVMYDTKTGNVRFDEAPDFDESREPIVGDTITVKPDGTVKRGHSNYIWHHKWLWVKNDYQGFDVNQSKAWSNKWLGTLTETADGNGIERWNAQLDRFNLEHDGEEVHYSVASPKHKIANAFTNTERKGVVDSAKDFFKEHRKSLYQDWFDKNNPLKGFDALTKATGGLSVYDQVQSLPATTAGMLKALTEGTAQHVKMANQHLKNVKMKYNVTLAMALEKIDKKQMDKAYPKYLAENGFDNWVNALGAYLGAERCLEMARLARAEGKTYKFPKGLTEQECQDFVNKAPQQFKAAADIFYKVNDNVISIMEDAEVFSHDLAKTLRTKYRKYCPLLRDFSDTAAADSFIGGLTEGGRGIGNVSVPLKRINIEGSERGVLNPLETILKSYAVMLNRAERNKVALMAVENSRTADLHELIQEVPGTTADPKNCVFTVLINGKKKAYKTTQDLYGPIVGYNLPAANLAFGVARTAARMLRTGATMSPSFILRNVLRDTVFAGIASKNGFIPIVDTVRGAIALAKDPAMRAEFEAAGVTEYNFYSSQKSRIKSLDAMAGETPASAWEIMKAVFSRLEATSDFFESSTRMGEYMKARQKGLSMEEAARAAREVTLDFSRSGRVGEQVNQVVPFFNACLQGGDKMVRLFREDFVGTSLKVLKYIVLPSLLIMAMNWDEDWYKDLDPDIKNNYWCLGRNIRIPKPQEAGVLFGSGIEALFQQAADKDKEAVSNFLKAFSSNMIPSVLPTLILPLIEWSANYSFFKRRPLVGNKYSRLPDELQYNDYTSELSKGIGSALKVSPMKIDNLVRGYTGTMGALLWSMAGEPFAKANNLPAKHFSELPFVRDFNVTDANLSRPMNEFYGILDKANRQHAGYGVKGKPEAAVKGIRSAGAMISKIRKDIDKITHSNLTPERKRELIDKRKEKMNQIAKQATARYGKYFE